MKNWQKGLIIFIIIMVAIIIFGIIYGAGRSSSFVSMGPYIARINVEGTISSAPSVDVFGNVAGYYHQWTLDKLDELMSDGNNKGIIFYIDTPGGGVYESDELYLRIKEYQEVTENPVYVAMGSMAASGGYYVAAPADKIFANRNTWTGSIGVTMGTMVDVSEFLGEHGVKTETFISGRNKAMGNYFDPMTDEQRNIYQALVDEAYDQFTGIVADEREFTDFKVRELADGRIYTAKQALELGLIDEIGTYDDAVADLKDTFGLENCAVTEFYYSNSSFISRVLGEDNMQQILAVLRYGKGDVGAILQFAGDMNRMPIRYMYGN
ncbi:peptidase [Clostridia bacterium]|nr:peptidase [Clostridia bacterium]